MVYRRPYTLAGWYQENVDGTGKRLGISAIRVKTLPGLVSTMAHEMIHVFSALTHMEKDAHGPAFRALARTVEKSLGVDLE